MKKFTDVKSGDTMCDLSYPHEYIWQDAGLKITARCVPKGKMNGIDLVDAFDLKEVRLGKQEFKQWAKQYLIATIEKLQSDWNQQRVGRFRTGATDLCRHILRKYADIQVFAGPSQNLDGSLAFAYKNSPADEEATFLFFADGLTVVNENE